MSDNAEMFKFKLRINTSREKNGLLLGIHHENIPI